MLRYIIGYGPASLLPALFSFGMVYVFTRILSRTDYGIYTLVYNTILLLQSVLFSPLNGATMRLYPSAQLNSATASLMKSSYSIFGVLAGFLCVTMPFVMFFPVSAAVWFVVPLLILRSMVRLMLGINRMANHMLRYNLIVATDTVVGFCAAYALIWLSASASSLLLGMCISAICCVMIDGRATISAFRFGYIDRHAMREIMRLAAPLGLSLLLNASLLYGDRFIVAGIISTDELATYAVAWSLVMQPVFMIGSAIALATLPRAMHILDTSGLAAGQDEAGRNGLLIFAIIAPACIGLAICHEQLAALLTGEQYRSTVSTLLPYLAGITLLRSMSSFYFENAFALARRTDLNFYAYVPAAIANIGVNFIFAPLFGIAGVVATAAVTQLLATAGLIYFGRKVFPLPMPLMPVVKIAIASIVMVIAVYALDAPATWFGLIAQIAVGGAVYGGIMIMLDGIGVRTWMLKLV